MHGACRQTSFSGNMELSVSFVKTQAALDSPDLVMHVAMATRVMIVMIVVSHWLPGVNVSAK